MSYYFSPSDWAAGAGGVARKALQVFIKESVGNETVTSITGTLEGFKLAEKDPNGGRQLTSQGCCDLDRIAPKSNLQLLRMPRGPPPPRLSSNFEIQS